jgi:hypothetical protein
VNSSSLTGVSREPAGLGEAAVVSTLSRERVEVSLLYHNLGLTRMLLRNIRVGRVERDVRAVSHVIRMGVVILKDAQQNDAVVGKFLRLSCQAERNWTVSSMNLPACSIIVVISSLVSRISMP